MSGYTGVERSISAAGAYYTALAPWYDLLASSEKKYIRKGLDLLDPQPAERILEIGFGTGYAQLEIASSLVDGFSLGLDISTGMAAIALKKLQDSEVSRKVGLICSDSLPIPLPADSIDGLFTSFTLELFDSPLIPELLGEYSRVLKPGGRLVAVSLSKDQPLPWMGRLYETLHSRYPRLLDCRPIPLKMLLTENGFKVYQFEIENMWGLPVITALAKPTK